MSELASTKRFCVIGAGPCGLTAAKNLLEAGLACDLLERESQIGGNWNISQHSSSIYASTHMISSKRMTEFIDFPMPKEFPPYPHHSQVLTYLNNYAQHFALLPHIQFNTKVEQLEALHEGWHVHVSHESKARFYNGVIIANGHHWKALWPQFPGQFSGTILHAKQYLTPDIFRGKRVLVVGAGNSGCDIAVEAAQHAQKAFISLRRGYHFIPKFVRGKPADLGGEKLHAWGLPLWLRRKIVGFLLRMSVGKPEYYGLPKPDHALFETHPIVNSQLLECVGHGRLKVKPNIAELCHDKIKFEDGTSESIDLLLYATGYELCIPFLNQQWYKRENGTLKLFMNTFHESRHDLFFSGFIQPDSGIWGLADWQCRVISRYLQQKEQNPGKMQWFEQLKSQGQVAQMTGIRYVDSPRHLLEVEYYDYRESLKKLWQRLA